MATLFKVGSYRIVVYTNDHRPPQVHAVGGGHAGFEIGEVPGDVKLTECEGVSRRDLRRIAREIIERHDECVAGWSRHHGK